MRIAIVDDLPEDRERLLADICRWAEENRTPLNPPPVLFDSGEALLNGLTEGTFDVIFLDIYMTGMNGMETARRIRERSQDCRLIFTTLTPDFAVESYDVESSFYLLKPYTYEKLSLALNRCQVPVQEEEFLVLPGRGVEERLYPHEIAYTEYSNRRVTVHGKDGSCRQIAIKQGDFADALLKYPCFCDCIKGVLVNFEMVEQLEKDRFLLKNGQYLPISRLKYQKVREQFLDYLYEKTRHM
ncbi:MAG: LytTR family DNA-binding domain-containing protein [Eubacteriales bacterium]|nr:LytTR family DNA-binding domain-containing protein [Eubacteriales bacterium]